MPELLLQDIIEARDEAIAAVLHLPIAGQMTAMTHAVALHIMTSFSRPVWQDVLDELSRMAKEVLDTAPGGNDASAG